MATKSKASATSIRVETIKLSRKTDMTPAQARKLLASAIQNLSDASLKNFRAGRLILLA